MFLSECCFIGAVLQEVKTPGVSSWVIDAKVMPAAWRQVGSQERKPFTTKQQVVASTQILSDSIHLGLFLFGFLPKASVSIVGAGQYYHLVPMLVLLMHIYV